MSEIVPSLFSIYRQTRHTEKEDAKSPQRLQQQRERVGVAMLGVILLHEDAFRTSFLQLVCEHNAKNSGEWEIQLEVKGCGDLGLISKEAVYVCEFKIDAPLDDHQDPDATGGYRDNLDKLFSHVPRRQYIVIQNYSSSNSTDRGLFKTWHDVRDAGVRIPVSYWVNDLFDSFAKLNIPAFSYGKTYKMKLSKNAVTAAQIFKLLENVANGKFRFKKTGWDVSEDDGYIGKTILLTKDLSDVQKVIDGSLGELAWYGYEDGQLSVWFYSGSKGTKFVKRKLETLTLGTVMIEDTHVGIRISSDKIQSDQAFFEKALDIIFTSQ